MSFWIHAYCNASVASVTTDELANGIADRLSLLTYLFCSPDEEEPDDVLARLRLENLSTDGTFRSFLVHHQVNSSLAIRIDRSTDRGGIEELDREVLSARKEPGVARVRARLAMAREDVSFCLKPSDIDGMGFPLSIAAVAYLVVRAGGGMIQSGSYSWMIPKGREVEIIADISR